MENKKFGLIVFKETQNIGDDIQSYAAIKFLPNIDYYIERESLNEFVSKNGEIVNTIMNGWYLHDITSLPPSPFINPFFISIHFTDHLYNECPEYLNGYFIEYLRKFQPIGCRDDVIRRYLDNKNIDNFWSGCLTLTIDPFENVENGDYICAVDLDDDELTHLRKVTKKEIRVLTHSLDDKVYSKLSYNDRMNNVSNLLKTYQGASLVVTSRLHCALPSLALKTPVILISDNKNIDKRNRIGMYLDLLNNVTSSEFTSGKVDNDIVEPKKNSNKYLKIRENLERNVHYFINNKTVECIQNKNSFKLYEDYFIKQKKYLVSILKEQTRHDISSIKDYYENLIRVYNEEYTIEKESIIKDYETRIHELNRQVNKCVLREEVALKEREEAIENYRTKISAYQMQISNLEETLNSIVNAKGYKLLEKFRKMKGKIIKSR